MDDLDLNVKSEVNGLKLSHIHGYRGFDCRDNLYYVNDGNTIVYHAAAAGVVLDLNTCKPILAACYTQLNLKHLFFS